MFVSVFENDDEAFALWRDEVSSELVHMTLDLALQTKVSECQSAID